MPNRDGGQDTGKHPNRQVSRTPYGYEASHERSTWQPGRTRREAFEEVTQYLAGPYRTEHRAEVAARTMPDRDEDQLGQYRAGSKTFSYPDDYD